MNQSGCLCKTCHIDGLAVGHTLKREALVKTAELDAYAIPGTGSLYSTAEDLYKWDRALRTPGQLLDEGGLTELFAGRVKTTPDFIKDSDYAYGFFVTKIHDQKCIGHFGRVNGFRVGIFRYIDNDSCVFILSNFEHAQVEALNKTLAAIIFNKPYELPRPIVAVDVSAATLSQYVGLYQCEKDQMHIFQEEDGQGLYAQVIGHSKQRLTPTSSTRFEIQKVFAKYDFIKNEETGFMDINVEQCGKEKRWIRVQISR